MYDGIELRKVDRAWWVQCGIAALGVHESAYDRSRRRSLPPYWPVLPQAQAGTRGGSKGGWDGSDPPNFSKTSEKYV
jgi:hypothetical protein